MFPVAGSHTRSGHDSVNDPESISTLPECIITMLTATIPTSNGALHCPTVDGGAALFTVTEIGADVRRLPAASRAMAVTVWEPSGVVVVFQLSEYGELFTSAPRFAPSSWNCTP